MSIDGAEVSPDEECPHLLTFQTCGTCRPRPKAPARPKRPTTAPRSADDVIASLAGTKDISVPLYALEPYLGERTDWLVAHGYPHDLRPGGWVDIRHGDSLAARVRVIAMAWRDARPGRTGDDPSWEGFGPGLVFVVGAQTWEPFDQDLGADAERMRQGYRYHLTDRAGVVHHLMAGAPIPDGDWDLEPYRKTPPVASSDSTQNEDDAR